MTSYVGASLRRSVATRARHLCEYCLIHEDDTYLGCQVDHVISEKHGGKTQSNNLGYVCTYCNRAKGTDIGSIVGSTGQFTRFFNPRIDRWSEHFSLHAARIEPLTPIGEVTARILGFNQAERILERRALERIGRYPPAAAVELTVPRNA
jgi:hypothetical protein